MRYASAGEFVHEYATNLSKGGLFIAGATHLEPLEEVAVEIDLPGLGTFLVHGEVVHAMTPERAARLGTTPGAGLAITRAPRGFHRALNRYLQRLGRRADVAVLVGDGDCGDALAAAGYRIRSVPPPEDLAATIARSEHPVVAVVVARDQFDAYDKAAVAAGAGGIVLRMDDVGELDDVLTTLDEELEW